MGQMRPSVFFRLTKCDDMVEYGPAPEGSPPPQTERRGPGTTPRDHPEPHPGDHPDAHPADFSEATIEEKGKMEYNDGARRAADEGWAGAQDKSIKDK